MMEKQVVTEGNAEEGAVRLRHRNGFGRRGGLAARLARARSMEEGLVEPKVGQSVDPQVPEGRSSSHADHNTPALSHTDWQVQVAREQDSPGVTIRLEPQPHPAQGRAGGIQPVEITIQLPGHEETPAHVQAG